MRKCLISLLLLFLTLNTPHLIKAQTDEQTSLGVFPAIVETVLNPQSATTSTVTLTNLSNFAQPIKVLKQSFTPGEKSELSEEELKIYDASSWIYISPDQSDFILQPKESKDINLIITQPKDASPGGHYATVYFQPLIPQELISTESIFIYARVAVLVFMQTPGNIVENINIKEIRYEQINNPGNFKAVYNLENTGNTHLQPSGNIKIYNTLNNELYKTISFPTSIILPGTTKSYPIEVSIDDVMGSYYIETEMNYGSDSIYLNYERKYFIVFPYTVFSLLILPSVLIFLYILRYNKRIKKAFKILLNRNEATTDEVSTFPSHMYKIEPRLKFKVRNKKN